MKSEETQLVYENAVRSLSRMRTAEPDEREYVDVSPSMNDSVDDIHPKRKTCAN